MTNPEPRWVNATRVRDYLGVHIRTVYRMAAAGTITPHKIEGKTRFDLNEIDAKLRGGNLADLVAESGRDSAAAAADVIARIRAAFPLNASYSLINVRKLHATLDTIAEEIGAGQ